MDMAVGIELTPWLENKSTTVREVNIIFSHKVAKCGKLKKNLTKNLDFSKFPNPGK